MKAISSEFKQIIRNNNLNLLKGIDDQSYYKD